MPEQTSTQDPPTAEPGSSPTESPPVPTQRLVLQFFLGPLVIVLLCAGIYFLFGLVVFDQKSPRDFLLEIRSGSASERWQAAFELSRWFATAPPQAEDPEFASELIALFEESTHQDPRIRRYLALAIGRLGDARGVDPLVAAIDDPDPETRLYAMWSLGSLADRRATPALVGLLDSDDAGVVKMATYALGAIGDPAAAVALRPLLADASVELRWNAALALARLDDPAGLSVLLRMTDPAALAQVEGITEPQKAEAMTNAVKALHRLGDERGLERIRALSTDAPYLQAREAATALAGVSR